MGNGGPRPFLRKPIRGLVFDGQSFNYAPATGIPIPSLVGALVTSRHGQHVCGISGTTYATRATSVAARTDYLATMYENGYYIDIAGQSDLIAGTAAATILAAAEANATARKAAGFKKVIICTVPPISFTGWGFDAGDEAIRVAYNNLVRASTVFDAVADIAVIPELANPDNLTYFSDGLHPTAAGAALIANSIDAALTRLGVL